MSEVVLTQGEIHTKKGVLKFELYDGSKKASKNPDTMVRR